MTIVDLTSDSARIERFVRERVEQYGQGKNSGPGLDKDPVMQVTLGYYVADAAYVALVFDTRPDAESDGEWSLHLEDEAVRLDFPNWVEAGDALFAGRSVELLTLRGTRRVPSGDRAEEDLSAEISDMLAALMQQLRQEKVFEALPLAAGSFMIVDDFAGLNGWPNEYEKIRTQGRLKA